MRLDLDIDPVNVDADGICATQTPAAGGVQSLTLNGALTSGGAFHVQDTAGDSLGIGGRQVSLTYAADETGRTFTITGTDQDGNEQTSTVAGAGISTVEDTKYWKTITGITVDDDTAGAITAGIVDEIITQTIPLNYRSNYGATVTVEGLAGTCQYDIDEAFDDFQLDGNAANIGWIDAQADKSANLSASLSAHATAARLKFDSYSAGAELQFHVTQASYA